MGIVITGLSSPLEMEKARLPSRDKMRATAFRQFIAVEGFLDGGCEDALTGGWTAP